MEAGSGANKASTLHGIAALPAAVVSFRPILAKSVSPQPLARALQDTLRPGAAPGPFQVGEEGEQGAASFCGQQSACHLCKLSTLQAFRTARLPQAGWLSMDQGRSLVPLAAEDPLAHSVPLVGIWAAGAGAAPRAPLVAAAALKFLCSRALADKAAELDGAFLALLYAPVGVRRMPRWRSPLCLLLYLAAAM